MDLQSDGENWTFPSSLPFSPLPLLRLFEFLPLLASSPSAHQKSLIVTCLLLGEFVIVQQGSPEVHIHEEDGAWMVSVLSRAQDNTTNSLNV